MSVPLRQLGCAHEDERVPLGYQDVPPALRRLAGRSLLAHLIKLHDDGAVAHDGARWAIVAPQAS